MDKQELEKLIDQTIFGLQNLRGTIHEKDKSYDVSMESWSWPQGVALFAMYQRYRETGDTALLEWLEAWFEKHIKKGLPPMDVNNTCPMLTMAYLYEATGKALYLHLCLNWLSKVMAKLPRTEEGGFSHFITTLLNDGQLWDDTLYMTVLFVAKMGQLLGREDLKQESVRQFLVHIKYLTDTSTGLLFHGFTFHGRNHFGAVRWARGNSWYTAGLVDYLEMVPQESGLEQYFFSTLEQQVRALRRYQHESGLWHTVIDHPETHLEASASAAFAYGILKAVRLGKLPGEYLPVGMNAARGVIANIDKTGTLQNVSSGTPIFMTVAEYDAVEIHPMPYGQSMALLMLNEMRLHLQ